MPRKYNPKTDRKNEAHKEQAVPTKFKAGFLEALDGRTDIAKALRANHDAIVADVGGREDISHVKAALIERFVWLEAILQSIEHELISGDCNRAEALGRWVQAVNTLTGLSKALGLERKSRASPWAGYGPATIDTESDRKELVTT